MSSWRRPDDASGGGRQELIAAERGSSWRQGKVALGGGQINPMMAATEVEDGAPGGDGTALLAAGRGSFSLLTRSSSSER